MNAYKQGFIDGITAYAHHKDGGLFVGTTGRILKSAVADVESTWNYDHELADTVGCLLEAVRSGNDRAATIAAQRLEDLSPPSEQESAR